MNRTNDLKGGDYKTHCPTILLLSGTGSGGDAGGDDDEDYDDDNDDDHGNKTK